MKRWLLLALMVGLLASCTSIQGVQKTTPIPKLTVAPAIATADVQLIEEGWSDDLAPQCTPGGDCSTPEPGYYYRVYESINYACGEQGNHQFMVIDSAQDPNTPKDLFVKFLGGGVGFRYLDAQGQPAYWPDASGTAIGSSQYNQKMFFRAGLSAEHAQGLTKRFRENHDWRMVIVSYCSHDLYLGEGELVQPETNPRWGYAAATQAVNFVRATYGTNRMVTYGGSAGAAGAFFVGKATNADAIIMDSQAADLSAMRDACNADLNVFGNSYPCYVGDRNAYEILAERIGFEMGVDEPYRNLEDAPPVYLIWNENDASRNAFLQYVNLHDALAAKGSPNVAQKVCINDPDIPGECNLHVPTGKDLPDTEWLVADVYAWALGEVAQVALQTQESTAPAGAEQATPTNLETAAQASIEPTQAGNTDPTATSRPKPTSTSRPMPTATSKPNPTATVKWVPKPGGSQPSWGSMLLPSWDGDRISAYDVLLTAESLGFDGMVATGAPSEENAARYASLDGWIRTFLRGQYSQLQNIDAVANQMGVPYTHIGYGPESSHQAGEEALDPLTWVPKAEALAASWGKGLIYGPAVMDWEQRIAPNIDDRAAMVAKIAPHVDIWMVQLGNYERWARTGRDDFGNPFSWETLYERMAWWVTTIKGANPAADVWVQAGIGRTEGGSCLPPQPVDEFLAYRSRLGEVGVDGLFVMPSQTCQLSSDPADHEAWLQAYEAFKEAVIKSAE